MADETTTPTTPTTPTAPTTAPVEISTPFYQVTGGVTYKLNLETIAAQVKMPDGTNLETRLTTLERAQSGTASLRIVDNIAARDALTGLIAGDQCWVIDATGDATVTTGGAKYLYMLDASWLKVGEAESMDVIQSWSALQDKPSSAVADIDIAVAKAHMHNNFDTLSHITDDGTNNLLYKGKRINDGKVWVATVDSLENVPANLAEGGLVFLRATPAETTPTA